jgi:hypothetical protein
MQARAHSNTYQQDTTGFSSNDERERHEEGEREDNEEEEDPTPNVKDQEHLKTEDEVDGPSYQQRFFNRRVHTTMPSKRRSVKDTNIKFEG